MSLPIETYRPIDTILRSDYLEWKGIRKPCCSEIVAQDTREARYLSRFDNAGRRGSCIKFAMREIRNYVRVGNWCDPTATNVYTYIYVHRNIIRDKQWTNFLLGDAAGCGEYRAVVKNDKLDGEQ